LHIWRRQTQIDGVTVIGAGKAELHADRALASQPLDRMTPFAHRARDGFGARPERRGQSAFFGKRGDDAALRDVRQESQRTIQARFANAVRAGDNRSARERHAHVAQ
jgi:hypothetical protein